MWTIEMALKLIRENQSKCMDAGYYLALAGGVLNNGISNSDLDLVVVPRTDNSDIHELKQTLSTFLVSFCCPPDPVTAANVYYYKYENRQVEVIIINH